MPAAARISPARTALPAQLASAARRVLRRWEKAASTTANTSSRRAVVAGGAVRVRRTRAESTLGSGQNTDREIVPARETVPYQAALAEGDP